MTKLVNRGMKIVKRLIGILCLYIIICIIGMQFYNGEKAADYATNHTLSRSFCIQSSSTLRYLDTSNK